MVAQGENDRARQENGKRGAGSVSAPGAAAGVSAPGSAGGRRNPSKRPKTGELNVLWSPATKRGKGVSSLTGGDAGKGADAASRGRNLSTIAKSFKERYGEDLHLDDEDAEEGNEGGDQVVQQGTGKRFQPRGGDGSAAEAAATMSPAKLAAEVHKARARAREERFGGAAQQQPPPFTSRSSSVPDRASSVDRANEGMPGPRSRCSANKTPDGPRTSSISSFMPNESMPTSTTPAPARPTSSECTEGVSAGSALAGAITSQDKTTSDNIARLACRSGSTRAAAPSVTQDALPPVLHSLAAAVIATTPVPPAPASQDALTTNSLTKMVPVPPGNPSVAGHGTLAPIPSPASSKVRGPHQGTTPEKVHTLRLRLRDDVQNPPARTFDGGVEESKGFDPPNALRDCGVEECKGFDPPNLPSTSRARPAAEDRTAAPKTVAATPTASTIADTDLPTSSSQAQPLSRSASWGPSFGIVTQGPTVAKVPAPGFPGPSNPWMLSPDTPTFARNQGRPLACSFPQQTVAGTTSQGGSSARRPQSANESAWITNSSRTLSTGDPSTRGGGGTDHDWSGQGQASSTCIGVTTGARLVVRARTENGVRIGLTQLPPPTRVVYTQARGEEGQKDITERTVRAMVACKESAEDNVGVLGEGATVGTGATARAAPGAEEMVLGVRVSGKAKDLLERLKREREESLDLERKLTQALMDI